MFKFPQFILDKQYTIAVLEMLNALVAIRIFASVMQGHTVHLRCDNANSVSILQTGRGRCPVLLQCARQIWQITARQDIFLLVSHLRGHLNVRADKLSRAHKNDKYYKELMQEAREENVELFEVNDEMFIF